MLSRSVFAATGAQWRRSSPRRSTPDPSPISSGGPEGIELDGSGNGWFSAKCLERDSGVVTSSYEAFGDFIEWLKGREGYELVNLKGSLPDSFIV